MDLASSIEIAPGVTMPVLGLGTYKAVGEEAARAVEHALRCGYRGVDTASFYGNEEDVARGIDASGVPREEVFIATKVWNDEQGFEETLAALDRSLARLGTDYVDLYLVHWPVPRLMRETWAAMEEALAQGKARAIGVCNHLEHHLEDLLADATVKPAVNQFEFHVRLQQPSLVSYCREAGITVQAWAPLMRGGVADIPEVASVAASHGATCAQVALAWIISKGLTAIPKSVHPERIEENAGAFGVELTHEEIELLDGLDAGLRLGPDPDTFGGDG